MEDGIVILDSNTVRRLEEPSLRHRVLKSLRSARLAVRPTGITVLELAATKNAGVRFRLLDTLADLTAGSLVRPMPTKVLEWTGMMIAEGRCSFTWPTSGMEALLYDRGIGHDELIAAAREHLVDQQRDFDESLRRGREPMRAAVAAHGQVDPWKNIPTFLDAHWNQMSFLVDEIHYTWTTLELPSKPSANEVLSNEAWRLFFESYGAVVYERTIRSQTLKPVQYADCRQLIYMAGSNRRILVTDDGPLLRLARAVLLRRYSGCRVLTSSEFIDSAS